MKDKLPVRKNIRLKYYDYSSAGAYFVTICTQGGIKLFYDVVGATLCGRPNNPDQMIAKWINELENKFEGVFIDTFVIMPNHIHLLNAKRATTQGRPYKTL